MKNGLDERQNQEIARIGMYGFYAMFIASAAVIVAELIWKGTWEVVIGETVVFLTGGFLYLIGCMKKGIWTKSGRDMTVGQSAFLSVIFSAIFTVFYCLAISQKAGIQENLSKYAAAFFVGISVLCFLCLVIMGKISQKSREKQEKKYSE